MNRSIYTAKIVFLSFVGVYILITVIPTPWQRTIKHSIVDIVTGREKTTNIKVSNLTIKIPENWQYSASEHTVVFAPIKGDFITIKPCDETCETTYYRNIIRNKQVNEPSKIIEVKLAGITKEGILMEGNECLIFFIPDPEEVIELYVSVDKKPDAAERMNKYIKFLEENISYG